MRHLEELPRSLPELSNLDLEGHTLDWVLEALEVYAPFIGKRVEEIQILDGALAAAEDQVYPLVDVVRYVLTLQRSPVFLQEIFRR